MAAGARGDAVGGTTDTDLAQLIASQDDDTALVALSVLESRWRDLHSCESADCWGFRGYPADWFRRMLSAAINASTRYCRFCGKPLRHCEDDYPAHRERCNGWDHVPPELHRCDPRHTISGGAELAEPMALSFFDAGAGIGTKCLFAERAGCIASGVEHNAHYVAEAEKLDADVEHGDVRDADYHAYDIVFANCPFREPEAEIAFEAEVAAAMKPGAVLILGNRAGSAPQGWEQLTSVIERDGAWLKPAGRRM